MAGQRAKRDSTALPGVLLQPSVLVLSHEGRWRVGVCGLDWRASVATGEFETVRGGLLGDWGPDYQEGHVDLVVGGAEAWSEHPGPRGWRVLRWIEDVYGAGSSIADCG